MEQITEEKKQHTRFNTRSVFGKSTVQIECPFCGTVVTAYIWSLAGGGKRCYNKDCKALHGNMGFSYKRIKVKKTQTI